MKVFQSFSIGRLHELAVDYIRKNGRSVITEDNESTLEVEPMCLLTRTPLNPYRISKYSAFDEKYMKEYTKNLINGKDASFDYDYYTRLCAYTPDGISSSNSLNQIDYIVNKLKSQPTSRRAQAITWIPMCDTEMDNVPCLQYVQAHIVDNKLDFTVMFRSNDMLLAFGANAYALSKMQETIAQAVGIDVGTYTHISLIPHVYDKRDADEFSKWKL